MVDEIVQIAVTGWFKDRMDYIEKP